MSVLLGPSIVEGNQVVDLQNGDAIFPSMLEAIRGARKTIDFETYIYWSGTVGDEFSEALSERARNGVKVNVTVDWAGSFKMEDALLDKMNRPACASSATGRCTGTTSPPQQPHPPQTAGGRRSHRLHRRRRIADRGRQRAGSATLARHALPHRRPVVARPAAFNDTGSSPPAKCSTARTISLR